MNGTPLIRLEVEYVKHAIMHAFTDYQAAMDAQLRAAVEKVCSPANLQRILDAEVSTTIEAAIKNELHNFFQSGDGKDVVRSAVKGAIRLCAKPASKKRGRE